MRLSILNIWRNEMAEETVLRRIQNSWFQIDRSVSLFLMSLFLAACQTVQTSDGNQEKGFFPSFFQHIKPIFHHYDSQSSYVVKGKRYQVMTTNKGYHETGQASWYGGKFNARKTASGQRYNMYALTAAHKTLPLHSKVRVTNLANGKSVVVSINDRGPFYSNRIIDLSYGAASRLGMLPTGTAKVELVSLGSN